MPYEVIKDGDEYVCRKPGGKVLGRHKTRKEAEAQMRALYAAERRAGAGKADDGLDETGELLVFAGEAVKALGEDGQIGGYLVRYGSPELPDRTATKDYFTPETRFGRFVNTPIDLLMHHALPTVKGEVNTLADTVLGEGTLKADGEGLWLDGRLDLAVPGVGDLWRQLKADDDAFGLSSGAVSHLVRRVKQENGTHWIKTWPIVEASITPEPGELRTAVVALKSLIEEDTDASASDDEPESGESMVEAWTKAETALARACGWRELNEAKARALLSLTESVKRHEAKIRELCGEPQAPRVDPAELARLAEEYDCLCAELAQT